MTDSKKSAPSALSPKFKRAEAQNSVNPANAVPRAEKARSQHYLYGGMLFPSRIIAKREGGAFERGLK